MDYGDENRSKYKWPFPGLHHDLCVFRGVGVYDRGDPCPHGRNVCFPACFTSSLVSWLNTLTFVVQLMVQKQLACIKLLSKMIVKCINSQRYYKPKLYP